MNDTLPPWNIKLLEDAVCVRFGSEVSAKCKRSLLALVCRTEHAAFHVSEFKKSVAELRTATAPVIPELDPEIALVMAGIVSGTRSQERAKISRLMLISHAHILAFSQSVHALADILAASIFYAFGGQPSTRVVSIRKVSIWKIADYLNERQLAPLVAAAIQKFTSSTSLIYLSDFVNASKHEHLIDCPLGVNFEEDRSGFFIRSFPFRSDESVVHPKKWVDDFIEELLELCRQVQTIGRELNQSLGC